MSKTFQTKWNIIVVSIRAMLISFRRRFDNYYCHGCENDIERAIIAIAFRLKAADMLARAVLEKRNEPEIWIDVWASEHLLHHLRRLGIAFNAEVFTLSHNLSSVFCLIACHWYLMKKFVDLFNIAICVCTCTYILLSLSLYALNDKYEDFINYTYINAVNAATF